MKSDPFGQRPLPDQIFITAFGLKYLRSNISQVAMFDYFGDSRFTLFYDLYMQVIFATETIRIKEANFEDETELRCVAKTYVEVPLSWDSNYTYSESTVDKNFNWLKENRSKLLCLVCWDGAVLAGLHILFFDAENESKECFIKTLWVLPEHRNKGLAKQMKIAGETWAKARSAKKLITHVFISNQKMVKMNEANGFIPKKIEFYKSI